MHKRLIYLLFAVCLTASGCRQATENPSPEFIETDELGLRIKGRVIHSFDPLSWQIAYNADRKEFRIHNDTMSDFYILKCQSLPEEEGATLKANLIWTSTTIQSRSNLTFTVLRMLPDGTVWLFNRKNDIILGVRILQ